MYNYFMNIKLQLKALTFNEGTTIKSVADMLSRKTGKKITPDSISQKLRKGTLKYEEAEQIADILGYKLQFVKKD